jgi:CHAT domain-containing protein
LQKADFYEKQNDFERAIESYKDGLRIVDDFGDQELHWQLLYGLGLVKDRQDDSESAYVNYRQAVNIVEDIRQEADIEELRSGVLHDRFEVYEAMVLLLIRLEEFEEAFSYVERARARNLLDRIGNVRITSPDPETNHLVTREQNIRVQIDHLRSQIPSAEAAGQGDLRDPKVKAFRENLATLEKEYQHLLVDLKLRQPEYHSLVNISPFPVSVIQQEVPDNSIMLEYLVTDSATAIFALDGKNVSAFLIPEGRDKLRGKITVFRGTAVRHMNEKKLSQKLWIEPLQRLHQLLIAPAANAGLLDGKDHLIIVPHGILHYLPFQALITGTTGTSHEPHFLVEDFVVSYAPSASVLKYCLERKSNQLSKMMILAPQVRQLPSSEEEAIKIADHFGEMADTFLDEEATEARVKQSADDYNLIHFTTTAIFNKLNPAFSGLELAGAADNDGFLQVHEILGLQLNADLVTLSGCQTALGSGYAAFLPYGDDLVSLTRSFLYAGTPSVIASLWRVDDRSTAEFMQRFYSHLKTKPKSVALTNVQREMIRNRALKAERYSHPFFWAAFILVGDWN